MKVNGGLTVLAKISLPAEFGNSSGQKNMIVLGDEMAKKTTKLDHEECHVMVSVKHDGYIHVLVLSLNSFVRQNH